MTTPPPATAAETSPERPWPVRMLTAKLTAYLAKTPPVWLEGQVVQLTRRPGQRTAYVTLRDTDHDVSFTLTLAARELDAMKPPLADGDHVVVYARAQLYDKRGALTLAGKQLRAIGIGELLARIEELRRTLQAEGMFAADRKKQLPFAPARAGLICGRASAAERDVVENARRRWPAIQFDIEAVAVQGPTAVSELVQAVARLDRDPHIEVIVIARGGGSTEDLLPFSNETLVRAVAACQTPVVSAIGHEVDTPLLDFVADVRASTPTDAAKRIVPDWAAESELVVRSVQRTRDAIQSRLAKEHDTITQIQSRPVLAKPHALITANVELITSLLQRSTIALGNALDRANDQVTHLQRNVTALSPQATLDRGYAVVTTDSGQVLTSPDRVTDGTRLRLRLAQGDLAATASGTWH